jgi:transcriptional regulator with XRE-family HTH domain
MTFGEHLRRLRHEAGLTLRGLAEAAGLDFTYLSKIENGRVAYTPSTAKIRALAGALGADELELLELAGKAPPELAGLAANEAAREFLRRARATATERDWEDMLGYLEERQRERKAARKKEGRR